MHCNQKTCEDKAYQYQSVQRFTEAVAQRCSVKKMFLEISQNSQENTCARVSLLIKMQALQSTSGGCFWIYQGIVLRETYLSFWLLTTLTKKYINLPKTSLD